MSDSILKLVKEILADNRGISESLAKTVELIVETNTMRLERYERGSEEYREVQLDLLEATTALRLIADHERRIAEKIEHGPKSFPVGATVRINEAQIDWRGEEAPTVGLVGVVARLDASPWPTPPAGKTAVRFKNTDVGYEEDETGDFDDNHIVYYIWTFSLEEVPKGTVSVLPEQKVYRAHPAPEGHRWAILYESDGNADTELHGHCCGCYEQMVEYTENLLIGRVEAIQMTEQNTPSWFGQGIRV
jgi:hypothetical protein